jgi:hypothetical protein
MSTSEFENSHRDEARPKDPAHRRPEVASIVNLEGDLRDTRSAAGMM